MGKISPHTSTEYFTSGDSNRRYQEKYTSILLQGRRKKISKEPKLYWTLYQKDLQQYH
jgi:hypothetical protein